VVVSEAAEGADVHGPVTVAWVATGVLVALVLPCVVRLVRLDYVRLGQAVRAGDVAELLLVLAMIAMVSPVGGPIPAAGWEALLLVTALWLAYGRWRSTRSGAQAAPSGGCGHHAVSAAVMLYMLAAMPGHGAMAGPWLTMAPGRFALPVVAMLAGVYFLVDAARASARVLRPADGGPSGTASRAACRVVMGLGMGYLLLGAL
jgi:hypothetical protein